MIITPLVGGVATYLGVNEDSYASWIFLGGFFGVLFLIDTFTLRLQIAGEYRPLRGYKI